MVGIPGSGKSTFAQHYTEDANNISTVWISRDEVSYSLISGTDEYFAKEKDVFKIFVKKIKLILIRNNGIKFSYNGFIHFINIFKSSWTEDKFSIMTLTKVQITRKVNSTHL